jgi:cbb3-type cytochrome oxidase maturation protein
LDSLFILVPLAILIAIAVVALFFWSTRSGQFDDLDGPAYSVLDDDDEQI